MSQYHELLERYEEEENDGLEDIETLNQDILKLIRKNN